MCNDAHNCKQTRFLEISVKATLTDSNLGQARPHIAEKRSKATEADREPLFKRRGVTKIVTPQRVSFLALLDAFCGNSITPT